MLYLPLFDLAQKNEAWAGTYLGGVVGVRLLKELKGEPARNMEGQLLQKKMISSTRMFGKPTKKLSDIKEAVATYTCRATEKLRRQKSAANIIHVFVVPKEKTDAAHFRHGPTVSCYSCLPTATSDSALLIKAAVQMAGQLFEEGRIYKKAGVMLSGLVPDASIQSNMFLPAAHNSKRMLMAMIDNMNFAMRDDIIKFAASGTSRNWKMRQELRSARYTTRWNEMFVVK